MNQFKNRPAPPMPLRGRTGALGFAPLLGIFAAVTALGCSAGSGDDGGAPPPGDDAGDASAPDVVTPDARTDARVVDAAPDSTGIVVPDGGGDTGVSPDAGPGDAGDASMEAAAVMNLMLPPDCRPDGGHGDSRWQDLYTCYFGPTGVANCTMTGCHGASGGGGIWSCTANTSMGCYQGFLASLVPDGGAADPSMTALYNALRATGDVMPAPAFGNMPLNPADLTFGPADMARIDNWIKNGARFN